jgi:hypothetical protein
VGSVDIEPDVCGAYVEEGVDSVYVAWLTVPAAQVGQLDAPLTMVVPQVEQALHAGA